jgi:hypothetical protein
MKTKVNLGLGKMTTSEKVENARHYVSLTTANIATFTTAFLNPALLLTAINTDADALEDAYLKALGGGIEQTAIKDNREENLDRLLTLLGAYIEYVAHGDEGIIPMAGMKVKTAGGKFPSDYGVQNTEVEGEVQLTDKLVKDGMHIWEISPDPVAGSTFDWKALKATRSVSTLTGNLTPGKKYWFRVAHHVDETQGGWSDPISIIVT